jgi:type IV pilus assembly protein PilW
MRRLQRGVGLIEVLVSIVIALLLVLVIYQIYEVSEGQKRTITAGSDATQNAAFGLYTLTRDIAVAGNGVASTAAALDQCAILRPIPVLIGAGATDNDPDQITVLYGGSSSLATAVPFKANSVGNTYVIQAPVGFSPSDVVAAVQGATCTIATVNAGAGSVVVDPATGFATLSVTRVAGDLAAGYSAVTASLVNLGPSGSMTSAQYSVANSALRTQKILPTADPNPQPLVSDVVNLKAQYGLDTNNDGIIDKWQEATGAWSAANLSTQPLATLRQIRAIRIAIVTRSSQYEKDPVTTGPIAMFDTSLDGTAVSMTLSPDDQHYRYKVLETIVPLRNAVWNPS